MYSYEYWNLNINDLKSCFEYARKNKMKYIGLKLSIEGYAKEEIIINHVDDSDKKLKYLLEKYYSDLTAKYSKDEIEIVGLAAGDTFADIERDLIERPTLNKWNYSVVQLKEQDELFKPFEFK